MGCCLSVAESPKQHPNAPQNHLRSASSVHRSNAIEVVDRSPPPVVEEETVKEVLSETPISKPHLPFLVSDHTDAKPHFPIPQPQAQSFQLKDLEEVISRSQVPFTPQEEKPQIPTVQSQPEKFQSKAEVSELSQLSEICSVAESFSTTTTATLGEKREDEATSKRSGREATSQRLNRSPSSNAARKRPYSGDSTGARERRSKSPARRAEPSPEKKSQGSSRSIRGRKSGQVTTRKLNVGSAGVRRDPSESSGRRSRSPSTRINQSKLSAGGRNQLKPTGVAGRQLPPPPPPEAAETAPAKVVENGNNESEKVEDINDGVPRESLENPHVSMECFIFL